MRLNLTRLRTSGAARRSALRAPSALRAAARRNMLPNMKIEPGEALFRCLVGQREHTTPRAWEREHTPSRALKRRLVAIISVALTRDARMYLGQPNRCVGVVWGHRSDANSVWDHGVCSGPTFISFWQPRPEIPLSRPAGGCGETTTTNVDESQKSGHVCRRALTRATTFLK